VVQINRPIAVPDIPPITEIPIRLILTASNPATIPSAKLSPNNVQ